MSVSKSAAVAAVGTATVDIDGLGTFNITYRKGMINKATTEAMKQDNTYVLSGTPAVPSEAPFTKPAVPATQGVIVAWDFEDDEATAEARKLDPEAPAVMMPITPASLDLLGTPVCFELFEGMYQAELKKMELKRKKK